ncbi:MAG: FapA family protein [Lachnospiraceae bacterium]|nr:FapA family protein [Lachnospiraceae bacterium]
MAEDMLKSIEEIKKMLEDIKHDGNKPPEFHNPVSPAAEEETDDDSPYCIKNGAYIKTSEDGMRAWIYLNPPSHGEDFYSRELIVQFIREHKIVRGLHESNISAIAKKHVYEREIVIAEGKEPVRGSDGSFEWFFDISSKKSPAIREDGTVDYTSMSELSNVDVGDKVAVYHPAVPGENGYDIYGKEIVAKPVKDLPPLKGRGFSNEDDPNVYIATLAGKISYANGRIDIKNVHEIHGDVDLIVGKVEFFGDIHILGNVGAGVVIRASRNVAIDGVVESATIYAGGDVVIARGIQGNGKGSVTAKGDVSADFIEFAEVEAMGNVRSNSFINSKVFAEGKVIAEGKNGVIMGGNVRGLLGVEAVNLGNETEPKTFVGAGYSEEDHDKYMALMEVETEAQKLLSDTVDRMSEILKRKRLGNEKFSDASDKELIELNEKKDKYFSVLDQTRMEKEKVEAVIEKGKGSRIRVTGNVFMGVTIGIEGCLLPITNPTVGKKYLNEGGRIVSGNI